MTARECLNQMFRGEKPERIPAIEWAGWWRLTLNRWHEEGLDPSLTGKPLKSWFGLDYSDQSAFRALKKNAENVPKFKERGYISSEKEYDALRPYLFSKEAVYKALPELDRIHEEYELRGDITWFTLYGYFWFPRDMFGIEDHLYSFYDHPELYHRICEDLLEFHTFVTEEITRHFEPQFMTIAEDMSYNLGPMLSEDMFNEFLKPYYQRLIPLLKSKGIKVFIDSDGDITKMVPWMQDAGVEGVLPLERKAGVDIDMLTQKYPDFYFLGGFDKLVMKYGEEAMRREFERLLPAMRRGHYIASMDHQTPPEVSLDNYKIYVRLLKEYCAKAMEA